MILTVTPNPALDVTYTVGTLAVGDVNRVSPAVTPGGKGVNVARVLARLGIPSACGGFLAGVGGQRLATLLRTAPLVRQVWLDVAGETRTTVALVEDDGTVTMLNEPGPPVAAADWQRLSAHVGALVEPGDVLVVAGSTPPGTTDDDVAGLVAAARSLGALTVVDTSGPALLAAARAGATVLKPNAGELRDATGTESPAEGAEALLDLGAHAVVVSAGPDGVTAHVRGPGGTAVLAARPPEVLTGNPTGAGDAAVAGIARALSTLAAAGDAPAGHGPDAARLVEVLRTHLPDVVALSAAAVLAPHAGDVDLTAHARMSALVTVEETRAAR